MLTWPLRWPRVTLAIVGSVTALFALAARGLQIDGSIESLLPADDPARRYYETVRDTFGSEEVAVIGVFADDVFAPATLAKIAALSEQIAALDGVREVLSLATVRSFAIDDGGLRIGPLMRQVPATAEEAAGLRARALAEPLYRGTVVAPDGRATALTVVFEPMSGTDFIARGLEPRIRDLVASATGPERFAIAGIPTIKVTGARLMERDILLFTPLALLLVIGVLAWAFRTVRGVLVPLATVVVGLGWTMGAMVLAGRAINMGTLVLPPLLLTIGIAYAIHVVSQYYQEAQPGRSPAEVLTAALDHVGIPVLICGATTLVGFAPFAASSIPAIRDFGLFSLFGVTVIALASFVVPTALLSLLPVAPHAAAPSDSDSALSRALDRLGGTAILHPRAMLFGGLVICLLSAWGVTRLTVETDYLSFFSEESHVRRDNAAIGAQLAGTQPIYVVVDGDGPESATRLDTLVAMRELEAFIGAQPGVDTTISLVDYLSMARRVLTPDAPPGLPADQSEVDQLLALVDPKELRAVVSRDHGRATIVVRTRLSGSAEVGAFVERVDAAATELFPGRIQAHATGMVVLLNRSADALAWGQVTSLWQVIVVLLAVMSFLFLSVRVGFLTLIPNVVPIIVLFGIMGWLGIDLNISTSMIASIAIGIAIDDTIHLFSAFNAEMKRTGSQEQAILIVMQTVGRAITFTTVALTAGFLIVCLSSFQPVRYFGMLSAVTMLVGVAVELLLTPALLATTRIITVWDLLRLRIGPEPERQIPLFRGLRPFQAKIVVLMGELASVPRGTFIARFGEMKAELYVLLRGAAEVHRGAARVLRTLGRGDVVGEMGLVRSRPRSADVIATEDAEVLVLHEDFLRRLRRRYPRIASTVLLNLSQILSDRLESTTEDLAGEPRERSAARS